MKKLILLTLSFVSFSSYSQNNNMPDRQAGKLSSIQWADSVFNTLTPDEKIAQLIVIRAHSNLGADHVSKVVDEIRKYNVGALCFFQGGPVRQANLTNYYQGIAKTPLMVTMDAEWGLGMRLDSINKFPFQLTLGSLSDPELVYKMGLAIGEQCKRIGVNVNFAPVVDINNNPTNPVIGYRSFGEDVEKVSQFGVAYMKGMQDAGILACAKHFPGHGDVSVDSHFDLPVINKSMSEISTMELKPFESLFNAGVGSVMIAHLYIPAIDNTANLPTSLSRNNVTQLLKRAMKYDGLIFTDALEMKGVTKYWPGGEAAAKAIIAGNDMLCLPESVPEAIAAIKKAIREKKLTWDDIKSKVMKVLQVKYSLGLNNWKPVDTNNLLNDLNAKTDNIRYEVAKNSLTVLSLAGMNIQEKDNATIPLDKEKKVAYVGIGCNQLNDFGKRMKEELNADVFLFSYSDSDTRATEILKAVTDSGKYDALVVGIHDFSNRPANNYSISPAAVNLWKKLNSTKTITLVFGNVLATSNFCDAFTLAACYQDDDITQQAAADLLTGKIVSMGLLPVSVCQFKYGDGVVHGGIKPAHGAIPNYKFNTIDSIINNAIAKKAFPGCVILAVHQGEIIYDKAFGFYDYSAVKPMSTESIFDLASVTKIAATTLAVMKLYEQGKLDLNKTLGDYLAWTKGSNKARLKIKDLLLHQSGLVPFIPFYKETIDASTGIPFPSLYSDKSKPGFTVRVAENIYLKNNWQDTMIKRILNSPLVSKGKYVYSDNNFIFLGKVVEALSGMKLDEYVQKYFYTKMGLETMDYKPRNRFSLDRIVPTETENQFRRQTLRGDVHDEGASMFGGVAGHAGLFSDAYDLAVLFQMLLNGGEINGERFFKKETINLFTAYHNKESHQGYGFDKPETTAGKAGSAGGVSTKRKGPYPSLSASD